MKLTRDQQSRFFFFNFLFSRKFLFSLFFSWLIFIGIDFISHASLLETMWSMEGNSLKSKESLFKYIPEGYLSFFLLTLLFALLFKAIYDKDPGLKTSLFFGVFIGFLHSVAQLLALHSFIKLTFTFLLIISFVYWIEVICIVLMFRFLYWVPGSNRKKIWVSIAFFVLCIVIGIILQNIFKTK